ncbi:hypothetical protein DCC79_12355 [bacterium]|nr:PIN domain-containing protein [Chloroflexi bacterium CFX6]RIL08987.1 MAG: hypothetical protein DCC79_12355 [bacterium]
MSVFTIDASVFGNATFADEPGHAASRDLLAAIQRADIPLVLPTLVLPEVAAVVARRTGSSERADRFAGTLRALPYITWVALTPGLAALAAGVVSRSGLRGADGVYVTVALRHGTVLVTRDREQLGRAPDGLRVTTPEDAMSEIP